MSLRKIWKICNEFCIKKCLAEKKENKDLKICIEKCMDECIADLLKQ